MNKQKKITVIVSIGVLILVNIGKSFWFLLSKKSDSDTGRELTEIDYDKYAEIGYDAEKVDKLVKLIDEIDVKISEDPTDYEIYLKKASIYRSLHEYDLAEKVYFKAIEKFPDFGAAYGELGEMYLGDFQDFEKSVEYFKLAIEKSPYRSDYYRWLADVYSAKFPEKKGEIESLMLAGVMDSPENAATFYSYLVNFFDKEDNMDKAIEYAMKALEIDPSNEVMAKKLKDFQAQR